MKKRVSKRLLNTLILTCFLILMINSSAIASENDKKDFTGTFTYNDYKWGVENGYIDLNVSYDCLVKLSESTDNIELVISDNDNFTLEWDSRKSKQTNLPALSKGDVIITNGTSSFGLTGHAGIAIGTDSILSIDGPGNYPSTKSRQSFYNTYKNGSNSWIKIYKPNNSNWGTAAATWAENHYKGKNIPYKISYDINSTSNTYCSKIVFQAYKFGAGSSAFNSYYHSSLEYTCSDYSASSLIVGPYILPTTLKISLSSTR